MKKQFAFLILTLFSLSGCLSLSPSQQRQIDRMEAQGMDVDYPENRVSPNAVSAMNVFFGVGNMYLASKAPKYAGGQIGLGILNLLTWPASVLWAPYQGYADAVTVNRERYLNEQTYGRSNSYTAPIRQYGAPTSYPRRDSYGYPQQNSYGYQRQDNYGYYR